MPSLKSLNAGCCLKKKIYKSTISILVSKGRCVYECFCCALPTVCPCEVLQVVKITTKGLYTLNKIIFLIYLLHKRWALKFCYLLRATWATLWVSHFQTAAQKHQVFNFWTTKTLDWMINCYSITGQILCPVWDWENQYFMDSILILCLFLLSGFKIESFERKPVSCRLLMKDCFFLVIDVKIKSVFWLIMLLVSSSTFSTSKVQKLCVVLHGICQCRVSVRYQPALSLPPHGGTLHRV